MLRLICLIFSIQVYQLPKIYLKRKFRLKAISGLDKVLKSIDNTPWSTYEIGPSDAGVS